MPDVKGSFRVNKIKTFSSNIQYVILFLKDRMVFVKIGGQFADGGVAGALAGGATGGALGGIIGSTLEQKLQKSSVKKKDENIKSLSEMPVDELLKLDKNNFELPYAEIIGVGIKKSTISLNGARSGTLSIEGRKKEKYDIAPNQSFEECESILKSLLFDKVN